jgi:uncharacterized protein (DUF433 family)
MMGKPVVEGNRITVEIILEKLAAGETVDQILEAHPHPSQSSKLLNFLTAPFSLPLS